MQWGAAPTISIICHRGLIGLRHLERHEVAQGVSGASQHIHCLSGPDGYITGSGLQSPALNLLLN